MDVSFHSLYSKTADSWSLLQLNSECEEALRSGRELWLKGSSGRGFNWETPTVICTGSETFRLKREKSSNLTYLAFDSAGNGIEKGNENSSLPNENISGGLSVIGSLNSIITMARIPAILSRLEDFMAKKRGQTLNSESDITFKRLFEVSCVSYMELYNYLFDYESKLYCDSEGRWYSINIEILQFLLTCILQRGMSAGISFKNLRIKEVKSLLREALAELEEESFSDNCIFYNTLKHALSFDLALIQLVKHLVAIPVNNHLGNLILNDFSNEKVARLLVSPRIQDIEPLKNLELSRVELSYKRIQAILALSIIEKNQVMRVKDYVEEFQNSLSDFIPLEISELEFEMKDSSPNLDPVHKSTDVQTEKVRADKPIDLYSGFPLLENHPDNSGIRFDILSGNAYHNFEDDTITYLPSSTLPTDPRKRLSAMFSKKKFWHISELSAYISPVLQQNVKLEAFCLKNCYICERLILNKNLKLFYNKNLPLMQ
ncbi:Sister chromatid cohesion protein Dcc1 [Cryptosporidium felis]|nr:Sister chromatid cohesion protein Dcc1 [Cryptosporidium felis]